MTSIQKVLAERKNDGKTKMSFVLELDKALDGICRVMTFGATKYGRGNWKKGRPVTDTVDSLMRHLVAYMNGEDRDSESGELHVDHISTNALFLATFARDPQLDDRL